MYRALESFTTGIYNVQRKQLLEDDFTTQKEIQDLLNVGYIEIYDGTLEITENGQYNVKDYEMTDVNVTFATQEKTVNPSISSQIIIPDNGKSGLSKVTVNAVTSAIDNNIIAENIKKDVTILNVTGTYEGGGGSSPNWSEIGYNGTFQMFNNDFNYAKQIYDNWDNTVTNPSFQTNRNLIYFPFVDTSNVISLVNSFSGCTCLRYIPRLDTHNVTSMKSTFTSCSSLLDIEVLSTEKVTNFQNCFLNCFNLSNNALNNILEMLTNATIYAGTKTLRYVGISSDQATICTTLSNYQAFLNAGWTTGY